MKASINLGQAFSLGSIALVWVDGSLYNKIQNISFLKTEFGIF